MDGATNELAACGYGRTAELRRLAEDAGEHWAMKLAVALYEAGHVENLDWRGIHYRTSAWPDALWERFCAHSDSDGLDFDDLREMRDHFHRAAARELENEGYPPDVWLG